MSLSAPRSSWPPATDDRQRRRLILLATWHELWAVLEAVGGGDRRSGAPFTTTSSSPTDDAVVLDPDRVRAHHDGGQLLRRAAELCGGRYEAETGRLSGCRLGLDRDDWRGFVC